jgi:hypothetical protein
MTFTSRENSLLSNTDVLGYIQAKNAERNALAVAEGWQFWTLMAESLADEYTKVYDLELRFAQGTYSDVYKEWCGCRPSINQELTLAELEAEISWLSRSIEQNIIDEQRWQEEQDKLDREEIAMGTREPEEGTVLEEWEIYEAKAEEVGY